MRWRRNRKKMLDFSFGKEYNVDKLRENEGKSRAHVSLFVV